MSTLETVVLIIHTFLAVLLIVLILLQRGKGADAGAAFGAGASGTVFGARGSSNFFSRATAILATAFFASSLVLAYMSSQHADAPKSLLDNAPPAEQQPGTPDTTTESGEVPEMPALPDDQEPVPDDPAAPQPDAELPALETEKEPAGDDES
ncbi:MAG: preprotein translocase subunit SecG [Woeseiaceae bacterium]